MTAETFPKPEVVEKPPIVETAEQELAEINEELGELLGELDTAEKNTESEELRKHLKDLRNEAKFTADWWVGHIYAFTEVVVGDGITFLALEQIKEETKHETPEEMLARAKKELTENGITSEQRGAYKPIINDALRRGITPFVYGLKSHIRDLFLCTLVSGEKKYQEYEGKSKYREDAWRLYLGMPQENDTFEISKYQPNEAEGYCYKLKDYWKLFTEIPVAEGEQSFSELIQSAEEKQKKGKKYRYYDYHTHVMGWFSVELGEDAKGSYIAYSDVWDLDVFPENEKGFFGKPFHIYDRLYYDPETFEPIFE